MTQAAPLHTSGPCAFAALALELRAGDVPQRAVLERTAAEALAGLIALDLAAFDPNAAALQLGVLAAHFDPVELLRPGWPLHAQLAQLVATAPRGDGGWGHGGRVLAFGARDGALPETLRPSTEYAGGPLRLLPLVLSAPAGDAQRAACLTDVERRAEADLLMGGMAAAATALAVQDAFGLQLEHARYLTLHDLCAMTALQYQHAGLAALWPIIETALLAPTSSVMLDTPPEPTIRYAQGEARIALLSPWSWQRWHAAQAGPEITTDEALLQRRFQQFEARQRQFAAVLQAHAVPVLFEHVDDDAGRAQPDQAAVSGASNIR